MIKAQYVHTFVDLNVHFPPWFRSYIFLSLREDCGPWASLPKMNFNNLLEERIHTHPARTPLILTPGALCVW